MKKLCVDCEGVHYGPSPRCQRCWGAFRHELDQEIQAGHCPLCGIELDFADRITGRKRESDCCSFCEHDLMRVS